MSHQNLGFAPIRVDSANDFHIVIGTGGELAKLDLNLNKIGETVRPFPSPVTSSTIVDGNWVGTWVEREFKLARMAAIPLNSDWMEGEGRSSLRTLEGRKSLHPVGNQWSHIVDAEPLALTNIDGKLFFASMNKGLYCINADANEIWRNEYPSWSTINNMKIADSIISFSECEEGVSVWSSAGGVQIHDKNGEVLSKLSMRFPEKISNVNYDKKLGWFISLEGSKFATFDNIGDEPNIHSIPGPIYDVVVRKNKWIWTGWRHDGEKSEENVRTVPRGQIGIAIIRDLVLTNDGEFDNFGA
ncbi:MAG: hypothetical protein HN534_02880 [Euryarchaeota archaeon]|mgnify:FL=1|jgi:hypothetical protein|nr:hypothetical protein [Euryarchaeota archaeon]MBT3653858.1 hypothetical protein [Euryarchaeota archaeon]MBT4346775.1 hypothetical protein [Euryarchaeota archaeon]MBT4650377.1 hypothetical protein [Euryarchaeota archaeon]MBT4961871.1 hypothetical protein [Euryarchaeota archaeon]|tara:strand:+ start:6194 stop:7093 length:900 start_codon:yes stop_codon:yes gene_type:complete